MHVVVFPKLILYDSIEILQRRHFLIILIRLQEEKKQ